MSRCMEWLFIDRDGNWEWMSPAAWRISDIDQQISFYRGRQRFEAEVERAAVAAALLRLRLRPRLSPSCSSEARDDASKHSQGCLFLAASFAATLSRMAWWWYGYPSERRSRGDDSRRIKWPIKKEGLRFKQKCLILIS